MVTLSKIIQEMFNYDNEFKQDTVSLNSTSF